MMILPMLSGPGTQYIQVGTGGALQTIGVGVGDVAPGSRGTGAVDLQTKRTASSQVAAGSYSTIMGGQDNTASGAYAGAVGYANSPSGSAAFAAGYNNRASGPYSSAHGKDALAEHIGQHAFSGGKYNHRGDQQFTMTVLRRLTTDGALTQLTLDGNDVNVGVNRFRIIDGKSYTFLLILSAVAEDGDDSASFVRLFSVRNDAGTTTLAAAAQTIGDDILVASASDWTVAISVDDTQDELKVEVRADAGSNVLWTGLLISVEAGFIDG